MVFKATILQWKAILARGQPGLMRWILLWIMQDLSLDLLISSPARYHCAVDGPPHAIQKSAIANSYYLVFLSVYMAPVSERIFLVWSENSASTRRRQLRTWVGGLISRQKYVACGKLQSSVMSKREPVTADKCTILLW